MTITWHCMLYMSLHGFHDTNEVTIHWQPRQHLSNTVIQENPAWSQTWRPQLLRSQTFRKAGTLVFPCSGRATSVLKAQAWRAFFFQYSSSLSRSYWHIQGFHKTAQTRKVQKWPQSDPHEQVFPVASFLQCNSDRSTLLPALPVTASHVCLAGRVGG